MRSEVKAKRAGRTVAKAFRRLPFREQQELLRQSQAYTFDDLAEALAAQMVFAQEDMPTAGRRFARSARAQASARQGRATPHQRQSACPRKVPRATQDLAGYHDASWSRRVPRRRAKPIPGGGGRLRVRVSLR
eukprot:g6722.t1